MSVETQETGWDFTPVHDLLRHFSINGDPPEYDQAKGQLPDAVPKPIVARKLRHRSTESEPGLGNFDKLWAFLGQPATLKSTVPTPNDPDYPIPSIEIVDSEDLREPKTVRWSDDADIADLADDDDENEDESEEPSGNKALTKQQRKKLNRKKRKAALAAVKVEAPSRLGESDNESGNEFIKSHNRRNIIQSLIDGASSRNAQRLGSVEVLRRPQEQLDANKWPIAQPSISTSNGRGFTAPPQIHFSDAAARKAKLMEMLRDEFPDERPFLENITVLLHSNTTEAVNDGLHVFVDASNIMIGFHGALKIHYSLPLTVRLRRQPLSFHSFSLVLTRGRPTSKLVLVGSDNFPAIQEARAIGYETNILDRVHKTKEITARQRYFAQRDGTGNGNTTSAGSGSESHLRPLAATAAAKWTEQAVDEILHLKMMESLVDCSDPSTMVLATGDAAEAEYSAGFLKMVERALVKGWKVELVSFRANTSGMYRRRDWREKWGERFKMIELDGFVECLLGSEGV